MSSMSPTDTARRGGPHSSAGGRAGFSRREALRMFAASIALGVAGCGRPEEEIVPYVRQPEKVVPGEPLYFATSLPLAGFGRGMIVKSIEGRPIKIEGNPRHPGSLGATDPFAEAAVLSLYDPARSQTVLKDGEIAPFEQVRRAVSDAMGREPARGGAGVRLLTGRVSSPTMLRQIGALLERYPNATWHVHEPTEGDQRAGAELAFGRPLTVLPRFEDARVVLTLDADPLGPGPDRIRCARGLAKRLVPGPDGLVRLYAVEAAPTLTGAKADERLALRPELIAEAAVAIANALGAGLREASLPPAAKAFLRAAVAALQDSQGNAIVVAGETLPAETHALVHWINARLAAPLDLIEPPDRAAGHDPASLAALVDALQAGTVETLVMIGTNPVYTAPADLAFADAMKRAPFRLHASSHVDETAALATWHVPLSHPLESWSDLRAVDGTAGIVQPLIRPLYATRTAHEVMALVLGETPASSHDIVRATWQPQADGDFEAWWREALHAGVVPDSAARPVEAGEPRLPLAPPMAMPSGTTVVLRPDPSLWDGEFAGNAWLQELPKPLTKQVWGNALGMSRAEAERRGLSQGDVVSVRAGAQNVEAPVAIEPGHADGVVSLTLGYGRWRTGPIGADIGANAYRLRTSGSPWRIADATLEATDEHEELLITRHLVDETERAEDMFPVLAAATLGAGKVDLSTGPLPTFLPDRPIPPADHAWAMVIDNALCIGCNACVVACQAENNVPVVGPEEISRGREMHWLRVDVYDHGPREDARRGFQPVPCMQCEHAPCEPVCPVAASVHDGEGLNVQVYNRCIGTRFCEANCPYKVRRFNFFGYADGQEYANLGLEPYKAQKNPEVTVRARGVMEKCTYCVQRISAARRAAEQEDRTLARDEVRTACQNACPTRAIVFGDLKDDGAAVTGLKKDERHYALLGHLGTRPRTTYLADIRNPDPDLEHES